MFKLGLVVNPWAGVGGPLALKGSDGAELVAEARRQGAVQQAPLRAMQTLAVIAGFEQVIVYCYAGAMGGEIANSAGLSSHVVGQASAQLSTADDTVNAAKILQQQSVDLILFVGGDGTARDIYRAVGSDFPVLGVPAGVKMHSGVYAVSPQAAGEILLRMVTGKLVDIGFAEVRDIDEQAFRQGVVRSRFYGELLVPRDGDFLQQVKSSGREVEGLIVQDIAADVIESMDENCLYFVGPGTTPCGIMQQLQLDNTLLGIDAVCNNQLLFTDVTEQKILDLIAGHEGEVKIIITAIGGQGHILGRGNQQFSPAVIDAVGIENIIIIATKTKITGLNGRPLLVDLNNSALNKKLSGFRKIITGYHDSILYEVSDGSGRLQEMFITETTSNSEL